jgi:D-alanyl-D-alanine dipeptidase
MGGVFDDPSDISHTAHFEDPAHDTSCSGREARRNRRLLFWAMHAEGFASLPAEWWHYDWGDQLWSKNRHRAIPVERGLLAFYGPATQPADFR